MPASTDSIKQLNSFLRGERSAVETYDQVIKRLPGEEIPALQQNHDCHFRRTQLLSNTIEAQGGTPESGSGLWGTLAQAATGSAVLLGRAAMIAILEEGEDRGLADYRAAIGVGEEAVRQLVSTDLLPAQKRTHARMSELTQVGTPTGKQATRSQ